jgi:hypothetical protein
MHPGFRTVLEGAKRRNVVAPPIRAERVKLGTRAPKARYSRVKPDDSPVTFPPIDVPALRASGIYLRLPRAHARGYFISPLRGFGNNRCIYFSKTINPRTVREIACVARATPELTRNYELFKRRSRDAKSESIYRGLKSPAKIDRRCRGEELSLLAETMNEADNSQYLYRAEIDPGLAPSGGQSAAGVDRRRGEGLSLRRNTVCRIADRFHHLVRHRHA